MKRRHIYVYIYDDRVNNYTPSDYERFDYMYQMLIELFHYKTFNKQISSKNTTNTSTQTQTKTSTTVAQVGAELIRSGQIPKTQNQSKLPLT